MFVSKVVVILLEFRAYRMLFFGGFEYTCLCNDVLVSLCVSVCQRQYVGWLLVGTVLTLQTFVVVVLSSTSLYSSFTFFFLQKTLYLEPPSSLSKVPGHLTPSNGL